MTLEPYRRALAVPGLRRLLVVGALIRTPVFATAIIVSIHVVTTLGRSYAEAGVIGAAATLSIAASGPLRGHLLDRFGMRRVVAPALLLSGVAWGIAPWVGYWPLLVLVVVAGVFSVPSFSIIRQAIIATTPEQQRRTAISLDSALIEACYMLAPAIAIWAASIWGTSIVLFVVQMTGVAADAVLWYLDPPLRGEDEDAPGTRSVPRRQWIRPRFVMVCATAAASTVVLAGSDLTFVAAMREFDRVSQLGIVLALWALGSLVGGLAYGALSRDVPGSVLLVGLAVATVPMAFAGSAWQLALLAFVAGLLCAPIITATLGEVARLVPANARGEAIGWHSSSMTAGGAAGAPFAGLVLDRWGPGAGFVAIAVVGVVVGLVATVVARRPATEDVHVDQHA
ncbi:MFS transporter [Phycicoccus flavus]|uniref:MFS transporter n=1 Tax=Phycicoccus flavus TaxID=2502783 RepID=UPI001F40A314|nr:MFS transporter [Phycicoccus flavus]